MTGADAESGGSLSGGSLPEMLLGGGEVSPVLPGDELVEDGEPGLLEGGSEAAVVLEATAGAEAAGGSAIGSRVGPQLAASRKKVMRIAAVALRMFQVLPQRHELFVLAISPLLPGTQTDQGRFCGGDGSKLPTSWG